MTSRRAARLALALFALAAASTSSLARADATNSRGNRAALSVGATVLSKCAVEANDALDVSCENALPARVEQSAVYTLQLGEQQGRFTTATINF